MSVINENPKYTSAGLIRQNLSRKTGSTENITTGTSIKKVKMPSPGRSAGDGMEAKSSQPEQLKSTISITGGEIKPSHMGSLSVKQLQSSQIKSLPSSVSKLETKIQSPHVVNVTPKLQTTDIAISVKHKEPKFVPYEPYKAAVRPIIPEAGTKQKKYNLLKPKAEKHLSLCGGLTETPIPFPLTSTIGSVTPDNVDNGQSSPIIKVLREVATDDVIDNNDSENNESHQWEEDKKIMEAEIRQLKDEKDELEKQFKAQTQVNAELKKLLVASVGEDMESRVHFLSEDKAKLAQDIAFYSQQLLEDNEELERLSIQCDVWRSKFLASSLMVDELAQWKAHLSRHFEETKDAIHLLLAERQQARQDMMQTYRTLSLLRETFEPVAIQHQKGKVQSATLLKLASGNRGLAQAVYSRLLGSSTNRVEREVEWDAVELYTAAEEFAQKVLFPKNSTSILDTQSKDGNLSFDGRNALSLRIGSKLCRVHSCTGHEQSVVNCCRHCSGEVKLL
ncbi:golgin-45-like isoform X1 [Limulus polyphemus]|uniref:Golgin-45-like isoform X1 n=2 Tax=Limulus polyphemus TaxID=6850 RepID=A0ABM1BBU4_LIMPO|nr:golgin-45-like isoform X1 [Limulus polyphemus]